MKYINHQLKLIATLLTLTACENPVKRAVREVTYSGYEMIGVEKRDLLKTRIEKTRDEQKDAGATFEDALDKLRKLYDLPESQLSRQYKEVRASYDRSERKAEDVRQSRERMNDVARDLFREWQGEISQMQTADLKAKSRAKLNESSAKFKALDQSLGQSEAKMRPILGQLKDHVFYLKHNLNAESLAGLKRERDRIDRGIDDLLKDLNHSLARAEEFTKTLR